jgi:hypothetical protein
LLEAIGIRVNMKVIGIFKDEPAFEAAIRFGREFRMTDQPEEDTGPPRLLLDTNISGEVNR